MCHLCPSCVRTATATAPPPPRARSNGVSFSLITWRVIMHRYRRLQVLLVRFLYRSTCRIGQQRRQCVQAGGKWCHGSNGRHGTSGVAANAFGTGGPRQWRHGNGGTAATIGNALRFAYLGPHQRLELREID